MNKSFAAFGLILFLSTTAGAQVTTNTAALQKTSQQLSAQHAAFQKILLQTAKEKNWPLTLRNKKGRMAYLRGVTSFGLPYYVSTTDNIISAATIRTNTLWPGGSSGLGLNGSSANMKGRIAVWDEGLVRPTHVELTGRVTQVDGSSLLSDHSTHVSGTMIAAGVNPLARGMSFGAQLLQAYDFDNDEAEMAKAAGAANNIIVSNHSYADIAGWYLDASQNDRWEFWGNPGDTVDIKFGLYDQDTQIWDSIAYNAPYYLIAKAGGNNPGETGPDVGQPYWRMNAAGTFINAGNRPAGISNNAGYNTIATYGCAKNILTLGAVNPIPGGYSQPSDVVQASFSSLGPTGDGRIKPDVVADGVNVLSSISTADNAYDIYSGTSMATPATAGSSFLLQEYYSKLHSGTFMLSSTLKGLIIHTADEAGANPGPDYTYGWGLVNIQKAAAVIKADNTDQSQVIKQSSLIQGTKDAESFTVTASGKMPVTATICWTDPPGTPANIPTNSHNFQDTQIKLVDDLDLRITDMTTNKVYYPWILTPTNPSAAATKGDNIRDNVEKVELSDSLIPGRVYSVSVTHKATLQRGTQAYSLIMSGVGGTASCASASTANGASIDKVSMGGVTFSSPLNTCRTYSDNSAAPAFPMPVGSSLAISIDNSSCNSTNNTRVIAVYIDLNNNGSFADPGEQVAISSPATGGNYSSTILVPTTVTQGAYARMRIIAEETNNPSLVNPCNTYGAGETQDYRVVFTNPANDVGVTSLEYPTLTSCGSDSQLVAIHIHNFGSVAQTAGVPVTTVISNGGTPVKTLTAICTDSIPVNGEVIFTYNTSFPTVAGTTYSFSSKTALASDVNTANDTNTSTVTISAGEAPGTGAATACGANATSVVLHADATGDDQALWYDSQTAITPIAAGNNTTTTDITPNKTYYLGLNDLKVKGGAPNKNAFGSTKPTFGGAYFRFGGNFMMFTTGVPLTIESAKMYISHAGQMTFTLAQLASLNDNTGEYSYYPLFTNTIDVYATKPVPDTSSQIDVAAGDNTDTGAYFLLNIPVPTPGNYVILMDCSNTTAAFLNANISTNPYPLSIPGIFSVTGNDFRDYGKADSVTFSHQFYYPFYDIGIKLTGCASTARTAVVATTQAAPTITQSGNTLVSSAATGNQWYLNDSLLTDSIAPVIHPSFPGVYYTVITDPTTGCVLTSNSIVYSLNTGDPNSRIGLRVGPNPSSGAFTVTFYMSTTAPLSIELYDIFGQRVYEQDYGDFTGFTSKTINTTLASGYYVMKIVHGSDTYEYKLIIKH